MKTIHLHISDFDSNEAYEETVEAVGLSRFNEAGDPKEDAETLSITGEATKEKLSPSVKVITFSRDIGIDDVTFNAILKKFKIPKNSQSVTIKIKSVSLS